MHTLLKWCIIYIVNSLIYTLVLKEGHKQKPVAHEFNVKYLHKLVDIRLNHKFRTSDKFRYDCMFDDVISA